MDRGELPEASKSMHRRKKSGTSSSLAKTPGNYSEGELSDDCEVEAMSGGDRSNYTNTSVHVIG